MTNFVNNDVSPGAVVQASDHNTQGSLLGAVINGGIDNNNIATGAAIATSKLADDAGITTAKIADLNVTTGKLANGAATSEKLGATIACRAYRAAAWTWTTTLSKISLDTENFDLGSDFDTGNSRFVAPVTGYYHIDAGAGTASVGDGVNFELYIYVNGAEYLKSTNYGTTAGGSPSTNASTVAYVEAGQYIELYRDASTTITGAVGSSATYLSIYFIGAV